MSLSSSSVSLKPLETVGCTAENNSNHMIIETNTDGHSSSSSIDAPNTITMNITTSIEQSYDAHIKSNDSNNSLTVSNNNDSEINKIEMFDSTPTTTSNIPVTFILPSPGYILDTSTNILPLSLPIPYTSPTSSTATTTLPSDKLQLLPPTAEISIDSSCQSTPMEVEIAVESETSNHDLSFPVPELSSLSSSLLPALTVMVTQFESSRSRSGSIQDRDRFVNALKTLFKYIINIHLHPNDHRFRQIRISNPSYKKHIGSYCGAQNFLLAVGFLPVKKEVEVDKDIVQGKGQEETLSSKFISATGTTEEWLLLPQPPLPPLSENTQSRQNVATETISDAIKLLEATAHHYDISLTSAQSSLSYSPSSAPAPPAFVFDPYKPAIFRTNPQPRDSQSTLSVTDRRLQSLLKKRADILASTSAAADENLLYAHHTDRCTTVISFPGSSSTSTITTGNVEKVDSSSNSNSQGDSTLVAQALARRVVSAGSADKNQGEGPPLTTAALREVWALEKAKVYSTVLVRVSFPDRVVVQGKFHPDSKWKDITAWLSQDCLRDNTPQFELSCSDPSLRAKRKQSVEESKLQSLAELGLVPAALLRLKWSGGEEVTATATANMNTHRAGSYLQDSLLLAADGKQTSTAAASSTSYPTGISLVNQRKDLKEMKKEPVATSQFEVASEPKKSGGGKPKWFKT